MDRFNDNYWFCSEITSPLFGDDIAVMEDYLADHPDVQDAVNQFHYVSQSYGFDQDDDNNITPLMQACRHGRCDVFDFLLEMGALVSAVDDHDFTLLHTACNFYDANNTYIIRKLISISMEVDPPMGIYKNKDGQTPLHLYLTGDHYKIEMETINILLPVSDPNLTDNTGENCLMAVVATNRSKEIVDLFIDLTNDINLKDKRGNTALHYLCIYGKGNYETVKALLDAGANPDIVNDDGQTPLMCFSTYFTNNVATARLLLNVTNNIHQIDKNGETFLHRFIDICQCDFSLWDMALEKGANPHIKSNYGSRPFDHIMVRGCSRDFGNKLRQTYTSK